MTSDQALRTYCEAFGSKDAEAATASFSPGALFEQPLLGQRLVGAAEIRAGHVRIFTIIERCSIAILTVKSSGRAAIAEARLAAKLYRDREPVEIPAAIVTEASEGRLARLSFYLDARPYRLWADGPILAAS